MPSALRALLLATLLASTAGCAGYSTALTLETGGGRTEERTVRCGTAADFSMRTQEGRGSVRVVVVDGGGKTRYNESEETGGTASARLGGSPGTWTLRIVPEGGYHGDVHFRFRCGLFEHASESGEP